MSVLTQPASQDCSSRLHSGEVSSQGHRGHTPHDAPGVCSPSERGGPAGAILTSPTLASTSLSARGVCLWPIKYRHRYLCRWATPPGPKLAPGRQQRESKSHLHQTSAFSAGLLSCVCTCRPRGLGSLAIPFTPVFLSHLQTVPPFPRPLQEPWWGPHPCHRSH